MAYVRRRPVDPFEGATPSLGVRQVVLSSLNGGLNTYTDPVLLSPQFWAQASNVYSGQHGQIRRARFAQIVNGAYIPAGAYPASPFSSMFIFGDPTPQQVLLFDAGTGAGANMYAMQLSSVAAPTLVKRDHTGGAQDFALGDDTGPWTRAALTNMIFEMNGTRKQKGRSTNLATVEDWGLNAGTFPPVITASAGSSNSIVAATGAVRSFDTVTLTLTAASTFQTGDFITVSGVTDSSFNSLTGTSFGPITVTGGGVTISYAQIGVDTTSGGGTAAEQVTKTVGRSYQWAEENFNTGHIGPPSGASAYIPYSNQIGTVNVTLPATFTVAFGFKTVTITGASPFSFTNSNIGKNIFVTDGTHAYGGTITQINSSTQVTINGLTAPVGFSGSGFIYDAQTTHIRLYATGDGGSVYFLIYRSAFVPSGTSLATAGLSFRDTSNSEPPSAPFTTEQAQRYNIPPPIGKYVSEYQSRLEVYGVAAAPASLFYSNIEATAIGQPPESFAPLNQITLPIGSASLRADAALPTGQLLWSDKHDMFKLIGLLTDNAAATDIQQGSQIQRLPYRIGAASFHAKAVTSLGAFWLSSDREVWLFTDHYAPKNVGKPIQDLLNRINPTQLSDARMAYYKTGDKNWLALALALDNATSNSTLCLLDLDLLASNGQPSYFTFDMATNAPSWYVYNVPCESLAVGFDTRGNNHLYGADVGVIRDLVFRGGDWSLSPLGVGGFGNPGVGEETNVSNNILLHALGNEQSGALKRMEWLRYVTNDTPAGLLPIAQGGNGWTMNVNSVDDDFFTFANPAVVLLTPGVDSPVGPVPQEFGPSKFSFGGVKFVVGRRFQIGLQFPTGPGDWALREIQAQYRALNSR